MNVVIDTRQVSPLINKSYSRKISGERKARVLNTLLRRFSISKDIMTLKKLPESHYNDLSIQTEFNISIIKSIVDKFLMDLSRIKDFLSTHTMNWESEPKKLERKVRCYLHRIHRLAPVFDYERGRMNLQILLKKLKRKVFWPKMSTQICIVIFVTDVNDNNVEKTERLIQKNIQILCNCSAYAFHRTRNILGINKYRDV